MAQSKIALQVYTLREFTGTPEGMAESLKKVAAIGYQAVELAGRRSVEDPEVKRVLDGEGLSVSSTHVPFEYLRDETDRAIDDHKAVGCEHPAIGGIGKEYHNEEGGHIRIFKKRELIELLESAGTRCIECGRAHALHSPYWWLKCLVGHKNDESLPVKLYHKFLVWDIIKKPLFTRVLDKILNPFISKSIVLYLRKGD